MSHKDITQHLESTRRLRKNISKLTALSNRSGRMTTLFASRIVSANGVTGPFAASATTFACQQVVKQEMLLQSDLIDNIPKPMWEETSVVAWIKNLHQAAYKIKWYEYTHFKDHLDVGCIAWMNLWLQCSWYQNITWKLQNAWWIFYLQQYVHIRTNLKVSS